MIKTPTEIAMEVAGVKIGSGISAPKPDSITITRAQLRNAIAWAYGTGLYPDVRDELERRLFDQTPAAQTESGSLKDTTQSASDLTQNATDKNIGHVTKEVGYPFGSSEDEA